MCQIQQLGQSDVTFTPLVSLWCDGIKNEKGWDRWMGYTLDFPDEDCCLHPKYKKEWRFICFEVNICIDVTAQ